MDPLISQESPARKTNFADAYRALRRSMLISAMRMHRAALWVLGTPLLVLAFVEQVWVMFAVLLVAFVVLLYLVRQDNKSVSWLAFRLMLLLYALSIAFISTHGMIAIMFLMPIPIISVLLHARTIAIASVLMNTLSVFVMGYFFKVDAGVVSSSMVPLMHWTLLSLCFMVCSAYVTWACDFLLRGLRQAMERESGNVLQLEAHGRELQHLATHDSLTGLANRHLLEEKIAQATASADHGTGWAALVLMDLDNFKLVNDSFGHLFGDELIQAVAKRLTTGVRVGDAVARLGGDEFAVFLTRLGSESELAAAVQRVLDAVSGQHLVRNKTLHVGVSAGVAVFPRDGKELHLLLQSADTAMYRAKASGRNRVLFFHPDMNARLLERVALEDALRTAIERGQLSLHYQPRVSAQDGSCRCAEALLRWHHPELGQVSPARFISVAEDTGLIVPIGAWVLRTAAAQLLAWQSRYPQLRLSINVSAREFRDEDLGDRIRNATPGLASDSLELEITESLVMDNLQEAQKLLDRVREHGVCVAIDDFGTGLSCLAYLKALPLDVIKIDKSFVQGVETDPQNHAIVKTIVDLAHNLQLITVAEGVETETQAEVLRSLGVNELQGYHFAYPMPADAFEAWLEQHRAAAVSG